MNHWIDVKAIIKRHEGYRGHIYIDTIGVPTGGYGHAFLPGSALPQEIWEQIFDHDYQIALDDYEKLDLELDPVRKAVVVDMLFNLGWNKFVGIKDRPNTGFRNTLAAIRAGDWEAAAQGMERSKWYQQVRIRAVELVKMMRTGEYA